ncbi:MAG TPA: hypothetical protein VGZ00_03455 [Candidatus Baltobacteraceae bacterium]|nr:hypothetical protein [Candidatus Baltobacteraceae bacterium]
MLVHLKAVNNGSNPQIPCRRELPEAETNPQKRASVAVDAFVPDEFPLPPPFGGLQLLCIETVLLRTKKQVVDLYRKLQSSREVITRIESKVQNDRLVSSKIKELQSAFIFTLTDQYKAKNKSRHGLPAKVDKFFKKNANAFAALVEMNSSFHERVPSAYQRIYQHFYRISSLVKGSVEIISLDDLDRVMTDTHGKIRKYFADSALPLIFPLSNEELSQENPVERMIAIHDAINKTAASLRRSRSASQRRSY